MAAAANRVGHWTVGATGGPVLVTIAGETFQAARRRARGWHARHQDQRRDTDGGIPPAAPSARYGHDDLQKATEIYAAAFVDGRPPVKAVGDALLVSRSTASRLVRKARERGLLDAAGRRRADSEQTP